jgi:hypothetical protein|tara:strand:+ start:497 stop:949 length:453 start_codon:yes stop_codon:yes gene_type:complete
MAIFKNFGPGKQDWRVTEKSAANLPQTTQSALFNVTGPIECKIFGQVVTGIQAQANNTKLVANPTGGTDSDLCTVLDINADAGSEFYYGNGTANAMGNTASHGAIDEASTYVVQSGSIDLNCAASNTGTVRWWLLWRSLEEDGSSSVSAA